MNAVQAAAGQRGAPSRFARMPGEFARYVIDTAAAGRILGVEPELVAGLAADVLPCEADPARGPLYDYVDVINLALFGGANGRSIPDLALRFLLRFAAEEPDAWYAPRQWLVRVRAPESAAGDAGPAAGLPAVRPADLAAPGIEPLSQEYLDRTAGRLAAGRVEPPGYQVAVRVTGAAGVVRSATANLIHEEMLARLLAGDVIYQSVTEELRMLHQRAWDLGMADCVVISRLFADRLRQAGLTARARRGYLLGLVGSDHSWCEVLEEGRWKPMDVVFEFLASSTDSIRAIRAAPGFAQACRGGRFNRLLPCQAPEAAAVVLLAGRPGAAVVDLRDQRERMAVVMDSARELIKTGLDYPPLLDRIGDHEDLVTVGVNSGEMIRIALACEEYLGRRLTDAELTGMTSVWSITAVLTGQLES